MASIALVDSAAANDRPSFRHEHWLSVPAMGGSLGMRVAASTSHADEVRRDLDRVARRVDRWAARLTRYTTTSDLATLNGDPGAPSARVGPTLAAALDWAEYACDMAPGIVDVTLLDARLAAEAGADTDASTEPDIHSPSETTTRPRWHLVRLARGGEVVRRGWFRFDLDGVAKGWIADRALGLLARYPAAMVDADGDVAMRIDAGTSWDIAVEDPRPDAAEPLAIIRLDARLAGGMLGIATSGTSIHRWASAAGPARHHLIDPRTRRPAITDVAQATVIAGNAREAEVMAKTAVIVGSDDALGLLDRPGVQGAILLLDSGETIALPQTVGWLA